MAALSGAYELHHLDSLHQFTEFIALESDCAALLLDLSIEKRVVIAAIDFLAQSEQPIALICWCEDPLQLKRFQQIVDRIDDYIFGESPVGIELSIRIAHAIHKCRQKFKWLHEQQLLKALLDNIPDAIYFKDTKSQFIKVNQAMAKTFAKVEPEELLGKSDFDLFAKEHAETAYKDEQKIIETGKAIIGKVEKETLPDGSVSWVTSTKLPLKGPCGEIIGTMGISRDITELKNVEETLAHETSLLKTIIEHALAGIYVKNRKGRYVVVNERHAKYLGAQCAADCIGKTLHDFFDPEESDRISTFDFEIIESGQSKENMIDQRTLPDGSCVWLLTSKVPLFNDAGQCTGLVGISQNITQQKKIELQLKSTIRTLEETRLQLIEAEKLKTVGRLAAGIAHEVKNPLSVVLLGIDYLIATRLHETSEISGILGDMKQAVNKANDVVLELLDYSSPHEMNMVPTTINDTIEHVLTLMRHNLKESRIHLVDERSAGLPDVLIDAAKIDQVFINLILNAISVMPDGGELIIRTSNKRLNKAGPNVSAAITEHFRVGDTMVIVEIIDSGTGIADENRTKVFDPFFSTKTTGEGTGLGLSVTRSIVEIHRGMITLENRKDRKGACARLLFPTSYKP